MIGIMNVEEFFFTKIGSSKVFLTDGREYIQFIPLESSECVSLPPNKNQARFSKPFFISWFFFGKLPGSTNGKKPNLVGISSLCLFLCSLKTED